MNSNAPAKDSRNNNSPCDESGEWGLTLYEPYHLPPEPKEDGDEARGGFLRFMSRIACLLNQITRNPYRWHAL